MQLNRREFIAVSASAAAGMMTRRTRRVLSAAPNVLDVDRLPRFVDALPTPEIAQPSGTKPGPAHASHPLPYYRIPMRQTEHQVHRDLPPARWWGYGGRVPGPTFETRSGQGLLIEWENALPGRHFLPIDHTLPGAEAALPDVRAVVHVHGARVPHESDGYPEDWLIPGQSRLCHYPNRQDAAMLWYHDHAMGINRLNIYAGLSGLFVIRDAEEEALNLPRGAFEVPLLLADRMFDPDGQLYYPVSDDPERPWIPEFAGNAILVNGKLFPYLEVEPRRYRLRLLNGANGRFFHLSLSRQTFHQIGTDQGLLSAPVPLQSLLLAPAERADLIVDFSRFRGERIVLMNDEMEVMQFRVSQHPVHDSSSLPATLRRIDRLSGPAAIRTRHLTLDEYDDPMGMPKSMLLNGAHWHDPVTEQPRLDSTEIWNLINLTEDTHPIHLHLVRFQILDRRPFSVFDYATSGKLRWTGPAVSSGPDEAGWKDTVRAYPGMVTRIIIPFAGYPGRYLWHCHVLEHEANEMMRPYEVVAPRIP